MDNWPDCPDCGSDVFVGGFAGDTYDNRCWFCGCVWGRPGAPAEQRFATDGGADDGVLIDHETGEPIGKLVDGEIKPIGDGEGQP